MRFLPNVQEHATLSAGASVDHGVDVKTTEEHENRAADRGCCVSSCSESSSSWIGLTNEMLGVIKLIHVRSLKLIEWTARDCKYLKIHSDSGNFILSASSAVELLNSSFLQYHSIAYALRETFLEQAAEHSSKKSEESDPPLRRCDETRTQKEILRECTHPHESSPHFLWKCVLF
jgi:hypothetical protein